jgi:hypothetical protein
MYQPRSAYARGFPKVSGRYPQYATIHTPIGSVSLPDRPAVTTELH